MLIIKEGTKPNRTELRPSKRKIKNNELPFIRRSIHTYFRDSNKEGGVTSGRVLSRLISTSGYSELGNHMLILQPAADLFIRPALFAFLVSAARTDYSNGGGIISADTHKLYAVYAGCAADVIITRIICYEDIMSSRAADSLAPIISPDWRTLCYLSA